MDFSASDKYASFFTKEYLMGPNCFRLADELLQSAPISGRVLDLGCGTGLTSRFVAAETGAEVIAVDLWCDPTDNQRRFHEAGLHDKMLAIRLDASGGLPFGDHAFDAIVSVDAYHYFACNDSYFANHLLPLLRPGGTVLIAVPGLKKEWTDGPSSLMLDWAGESDSATFHSTEWWDKTITGQDIAQKRIWEAECNRMAWQEWFATGHEYGLNDQKFFDAGLDSVMTLICICVTKKA